MVKGMLTERVFMNILKVDIKETTVYIKMPASLSALIVVLGDSSPKTETVSSVSEQLDKNGVCWNYHI